VGRFGVVPNPGSFACRNHELLEISNLSDVLVEIRVGHLELELASYHCKYAGETIVCQRGEAYSVLTVDQK
jgi:hypothetical protein